MEVEKKITRRIGSVTFGIMMILMGINIFLQTITSLDLFRFTLSLWPIVFISLGIETLYYSYKKDIEIKYDILGIFTIFIVLFLGAIFSVVNYGVNKVLYDDQIKSEIMESLVDIDHIYSFKDKVYIDKKANENVIVKFVEDKNINNVYIEAKVDYDEAYTGSIIKILKDRDAGNNVFYINSSEEKIEIRSIPEYIKTIEITVTASDRSKLIYNGDVIYK